MDGKMVGVLTSDSGDVTDTHNAILTNKNLMHDEITGKLNL